VDVHKPAWGGRGGLYDALGRTLGTVFDARLTGTADVVVEAAGLPPGAYLLRVEGESFVETRRFVVFR